ncbi:hypothetical protein Tco_1275602 [Tanacetum coccineum]
MAMNNLYQPWRAILSMINQCLIGKTSSFDRPRYPVLQMLWGIITSTNFDYAKLMWEEFVQAIKTFLTDKANLGSPTKKGRKDKPHVITYYRFTKLIICHLGRKHNLHQRSESPLHLAKEDLRLGNLKFVPKGEKDDVFGMQIPNVLITDSIRNAPYYEVYLGMVAKHDRNIAAEKEGKKKSISKADPSKKPATVKQLKPKCVKEKSSKLAPALKPKGQAHVGGVAIREPIVEATRPLPVGEGKGKAIATEEQAAQSLLALHTPKRKIRDSPSPANAETDADTDKTNSGGNTEILQIGEEQGENVDNQVFIDKDQARPDPGESRVALAGPNPKTTHDEFMANVYPNVHESLKFLVDEHVILEDPLNELGKLNVEAEVVSMVTVLIYQASSSVPLLSTPVINLSPPKPVPSTTQAPIFIAITTTTTTTLPPHPQQQSTIDSELVARVIALENKFSNFKQKSNTLDNTTQNLGSRVFTLELQDLPYKINQTINEVVKEAVHVALQAPLIERFKELPKADMKEILHQRMFESGTYKSLPEHVALYEALEASMERANTDESRKRCSTQPPTPQSSVWKTSDIIEASSSSFRKIKKKLSKADLEGLAFKVVQPFQDNIISLQFYMEECHLLLTDQVDLVNPEGHRVMPDMSKPLSLGGPPGQVTIQTQYFFNKDLEYLVSGDKGRRSALSISKLKAAQYLDFGLEELVPSLWIESEWDYDISVAYGISHWWFKRKEFYITRHSAPSDCSKVRSHMRILSVVSLKTFERYGYTFLKEIFLRRADYKEYKISEADFKNLHPNVFKDLYLLHLQGQLNHLSGADKIHLFNVVNLWIRNIIIRKCIEDLQLRIESYQSKLNLTQPDWDASDFLYKEGYTIVSKPRALDHMVKDFKLFKYNLGMEARIWSEDDRRRSKDFMEGQDFDALPTNEEIIYFLIELGHIGEINSLNDVVVDQMHQPWRTFVALINKSLSGKTNGLDKLCLSRA